MDYPFNENRFPLAPQYSHDYQRRVNEGRTRMRELKVVIAGLARNIEAYVSLTRVRLSALGEMFQNYKILVFENDSADRTLEYLRAWETEDKHVVILSETLGDPVNPGTRCLDRAQRMANYRNVYRRYIAENLADHEYTIVVDTDLQGGFSYLGVANSFGHDNWDMMGSNGIMQIAAPRRLNRNVHFDAWAFRFYGRPDPHKPGEVNPLTFNRGEPPFQMFSCFGGMGIYRTKAMQDSIYAGGDCEHVPFHFGMRRAGLDKILLNPSQIVDYGLRTW